MCEYHRPTGILKAVTAGSQNTPQPVTLPEGASGSPSMFFGQRIDKLEADVAELRAIVDALKP